MMSLLAVTTVSTWELATKYSLATTTTTPAAHINVVKVTVAGKHSITQQRVIFTH